MKEVSMQIIGHYYGPLSQKFGLPRQANLAPIQGYIQLQPPFNTPHALKGITHYSHLWLLWLFHQNTPQTHFQPLVRPPRLGGNATLGVFASRSMYRPNPIGQSAVTLLGVDTSTDTPLLHIQGADLVDGTPIIDIKPYLPYSDCITHATCTFAEEKPEIFTVEWSHQASQHYQHALQQQQVTPEDAQLIEQLLSADPRPQYHDDSTRQYRMRFKQLDIVFTVNTAPPVKKCICIVDCIAPSNV